MTTREQQYSPQLDLSSPTEGKQTSRVQLPEPTGSGDRATIRNILSWCASVRTSAGKCLGALDRVVWCALFGFTDLASGVAYPALTTVAHLTGVSLRRVRLAVRALENVGLLRPHFRPGRPTLYTLLLPSSSPLQPPSTPARAAPARARAAPRHNRPAPAQGTPARHASTPAQDSRGPRQGMPPNVPKEENKSELLARSTRTETPAQPTHGHPSTDGAAESATASGCAPAHPTATAGRPNVTDGANPVQKSASPPKGARSAQAQALALALAAHLGSGHPGTGYPLAPPRPIEPQHAEHLGNPGTTAPSKEPDTPPDVPPALAGVLGRVTQLNRAKG